MSYLDVLIYLAAAVLVAIWTYGEWRELRVRRARRFITQALQQQLAPPIRHRDYQDISQRKTKLAADGIELDGLLLSRRGEGL